MSDSLPSLSHPVWRDLVNGNKAIKFDFLAVSMILTRLQQDYKKNPGGTKLVSCAEELYSFFNGKKHLPIVIEDIKKISNLCTRA